MAELQWSWRQHEVAALWMINNNYTSTCNKKVKIELKSEIVDMHDWFRQLFEPFKTPNWDSDFIMVHFKDISSSPGIHHLIILDDESHDIERGTTLAVYDPLVGRYAKQWPKLTNRIHIREWSREIPPLKDSKSKMWALEATHHQQSDEPISLPTLEQRIIEGEAKWGDPIRFGGEFHYVKSYWEWTEDILSRCKNKLQAARIYDSVYASLFTYDCNSNIVKAFCEAWCPSTNTLLTSHGELSISLWDLHTLAGLHMTGFLYDEVVPSAMELTGVDEAGLRFLPRSCNHLLHAYHLLQGSAHGDHYSQVSIDDWINFWFKKATKYDPPPMRKERKAPPRKEKQIKHTESTHNPLGDIGVHGEWSPAEKALFSKLGVKESSMEETYLAAYLACWLCLFVLPNDDLNSIRPGTFKMASLMAYGQTTGLVVPVLASIFGGLNKIANSPRPSKVYSTFPVHFVYGWLAYYFKTHNQVWQGTNGPKMAIFSGEGHTKYYEPKEARRRIHKGDWISWTCTMITKNKDFHYVDNGNAQKFEQEYFIAIRSSYLSLRQGGRFVIEPYSPHRFSRQFGFYQMVSGVLKEGVRGASLEEGVYHWRVCTSSKTFSKAWLPCMPPTAKTFSSEEYKQWWAWVHGNYFEENIENLINSKPKKVLPKEKRPRRGPLGEIIRSSLLCDVLGVEVCESNKRKVVIPSFEESSSSDADHHWKRLKTTHKSLEQQEANDVASNQPLTENFVQELEKQLLDNECECGSQDSQKSIMGPNLPTVNRQKVTSNSIEAKTSPCAVFSVFQGEKFIRNHQQEYLQKLWGDLREKISNIPIDSLSSIQDEIVSKELIAQQLNEVKDRLHGAKTKEAKESARISSTKEELESINRELDNLRKRKKSLTASLKRQEELLHIAHIEVQQIEDEIVAIQNTSPSNDEILEKLELSTVRLEAAKEELKSLRGEVSSLTTYFAFGGYRSYFILMRVRSIYCLTTLDWVGK
ncbi:hypothetical protein DH2020_046957 [Rehmannia glutinosa]|uniref:Aminotransferase-like plant mobile domain-containing protein n=1 Tax=Rehmannia glutinosa TaxID=99300 RepID=A0ABR0U9Y6_REHGL